MTKQVFTANQVLTAAQMNSLQNNDFNWDTSTKTTSYVLLAADAGTRVIMNSASNTTITVNTGLFAAGDVLWIHNINTGTCTVTAGTATVNSAGSLALAQWEGGALYFTSASSAIFFRAGGIGYGVATGGSSASRTVGGINYTVLTFATDDNLVVSRAGLFDVLLVGGGGGGGGGNGGTSSTAGGGGGAGALVGFASTTTVYLAAGTYAVDVGAGGAGGANFGNPGAASYIGSVISACAGGGGSGSNNAGATPTAGDGGSGGGNGNASLSPVGQSVDETFGNDGGTSAFSNSAGGGGGYASVGGNAASGVGGSGGNGIDVSSWGTSATTDNIAAGGGGGAQTTGGAAGTGGVAGKTSGTGNAATTAGSGGGGSYFDVGGGNGAAGKVWVRFRV